MHITQVELQRERIPLAFRDYCAHLLPELNKCRRANWYLPWHCEEERVAWTKCQYDDYQRRMKILDKRKKLQDQQQAAGLEAD
ncbi:hypothetical protein HK100_003022 [Physocladia obscura]|uniref:NADH dehydrogenase [ubiquinone] 1 beta subcomplex subunit 7 n=1 Tax=Physocladia obscura TaxID=109957 RepID=A0AAD5SUU3_9FUNG|nr:hypothetical protein HK100_003022 [Physocladia obscura]